MTSSGTAVHELPRLEAQLGAPLDVVAQDVAGRDLGDAVLPGQEVGLRALAAPRRPEQQQVHGFIG